MVESFLKMERLVIRADFRGHARGGRRRGEGEEVLGRDGVKDRNAEGQMLVNFAKSKWLSKRDRRR